MRPVFDPTGGPDVLVEKMIGTAYETVKRVYCHLPEIRRLDGVLTEIPVLAQTSVDNALAVALPPIHAQMDEKVQAAEGWAGEAEASAEAAAQSALAATKVNMMFPFTSDVSQMVYDVTVISGQTDVNTAGMALWVEGAIEFDFTILSSTTFMLNDATAYPENAQMRVILNAHFNDLVHGFDQLLGALEQEYKDAASLNGRWCGVHVVPPTTRLDGSPFQEADEYQNRSDKLRYSWSGTAWVALNSSAQQLEVALGSSAGGEKVASKRPIEPNAKLFYISKYHENRPLSAATDFGISFGSSSDQTAAFKLMTEDLAGIAKGFRGPCPSVQLKHGKLRIDGNIELYPFMRFISGGGLDISATGNPGVTFWVRNDNIFGQGVSEADYNIGSVFDGANGAIRVLGDKTPGSVAFQFGNAAGMASGGKYSAFCGLSDMHLNGFDYLVQFTNNNVFANRFSRLKMTSAQKFAVRNLPSTVVNSGELINFDGCFINGCKGGIETNAEIEIRYSGGSISFNEKPIRLNGNHIVNLHLDGVHFENFGTPSDYALIKSTATGTQNLPVVNLSGYILPSSGPGVLPKGAVLREMFKGRMQINFGPLNLHSDTYGIDGAEFQSLCDADVLVRGAANVKVGSSTRASVSPISRVPDPQASSIARYTAGTNTTLTSVTGGSPERTALKLTSTGGQRSAQTDYFPVVAGEIVYGSAIVDLSLVTAGAKVSLKLHWFYSDKTLISTTAYITSDLTAYASTTGWKNIFQGTGRPVVPAGAAYARMEFATDTVFAGDMLITSFLVSNA